MGFSKDWSNKDKIPKKARELPRKKINVSAEIAKLAKPETTTTKIKENNSFGGNI